MTLDFQYFPLVYSQEKEHADLPGVVVQSGARTAQRHRREDILALLLSLEGDHRYAREETDALIRQAADIFFGAQGSLTRALQEMTDWINGQILERNIDRGYEGIRATASLNAVALHKGCLFLAQFGNTTTFLITSEFFEEFGKDEGKSEALGQSKRIQVRFYQAEVQSDDLLLMSANPPDSWNGYNLAGSTRLTMAQVKRRLLNQVSGELKALVIRMKEGQGNVLEGSWKSDPETQSAEPERQLIEQGETKSREETVVLETEQAGSASTEIPPQEFTQQTRTRPSQADLSDQQIPVKPGETATPIWGEVEKSQVQRTEMNGNPTWLVWIARRWMDSKTIRAQIQRWVTRIRRKILPATNRGSQFSPIVLIFLAIAIPLVIILSALTVYQRTGKKQQYAIYMDRAQESAGLARNEEELAVEYDHWASTLELVRLAEEYDVTSESRALFEQAQYRMDEMDLAARLDFRPALTNFFPDGVVIQRIQASSSGVYLLDETSGSVLRIFLSNKGFYEIDNEFQCAPGPYGLETVANIVDFVTLPANDENYKVMALDGQGNLLYCRPGELPDSRTLTAPDGGWGRIEAVAYDQDVLYVLDAEKDAIWMYAGKDPIRIHVEGVSGIVFYESPVPFFDEDVPDLGGSADVIVNQEDLYILHEDGHMSLCRYSPSKELRLTTCEDPAPYTDNRVGRENKKPWIFMDAAFIMMEQSKLPNASLYILDADNPAIYQFSFQLNLERTLKVQPNRSYPVPDKAPSGFGLTPDLELFLAFDNQLFIAVLR